MPGKSRKRIGESLLMTCGKSHAVQLGLLATLNKWSQPGESLSGIRGLNVKMFLLEAVVAEVPTAHVESVTIESH